MGEKSTKLENNDQIQEWYNQAEQIYWNCFHETPEIMESVPLYEKCAEHGYPPALLRLFCLERNNDRGEKWKIQCMEYKEWFLEKANSGNTEYECDMGLYYRWIDGDMTLAFDYFKKSETQEFPKSFICLFEMYKRGLGTDKDLKSAFQVCLKAAKQGMRTAQLHVGVGYLHGDGVKKDSKKAKKWFTKAHDNGLVQASYWLGRFYSDRKKYDKAVEWYQISMDKGDAEGTYELAMLYSKGTWKQKDSKKAVLLMRKAAEQGYHSAILQLAEWYYNGENVNKNFTEAFNWLNKLVTLNKNSLKSRYMLGLCYYHGHGVKQDFQQAVSWFEKSAEHRYWKAVIALARCYEYGEGVEQDINKATKIIQEPHRYTKSTKRRLEEVTRIDKRRKEEVEHHVDDEDSGSSSE